MGKASRDKGAKGERDLVNWLKSIGLSDAKRVPLSGAAEGFPGDVIVRGLTLENKLRKDGFRELYRWSEGADIVVLKADRRGRLFVLPEETMVSFFRWAGLL